MPETAGPDRIPSHLRTPGIDYETRANQLRIGHAQELLAGREFPQEFRDDEHFQLVFHTKYERGMGELHDLERFGVPRETIRGKAVNIALRDTIDLVRAQQLAAIDPLTQSWTRGATENHVKELAKRVDYGNNVGLILADIDKFKDYNDTFGHHVGDVVLRSFTDLVQQELSGSQTLGRIGGEEFLVVVPGMNDATQTAQLAELLRSIIDTNLSGKIVEGLEKDIQYQSQEVVRLRGKLNFEGLSDEDLLDRLRIYETDIEPTVYGESFDQARRDRQNLRIAFDNLRAARRASEALPERKSTASFGVTTITENNKTAPLQVHLTAADAALYRAKQNGRNLVYDAQGNVTHRLRPAE